MKAWYLIVPILVSFSTLTEPLDLSVINNVTLLQQGRIVNGRPASRYQFSYQISYHLNGQHVCGGSILTEYWVVTAAHCILGPTDNILVIAGLLNQGENHPNVQRVRVHRQILHPEYPGGIEPTSNDIALLQLATPLKFTRAVNRVRLPVDNQEFSGLGLISGWGYLSSDSQTIIPTRLQYIQLNVQTFIDCSNNLIRLMDTSRPLDDTMICFVTYNTPCEGICQGDSGGPAVQNGILMGVASWTLTPCGYCTAPSVYTKVSKHLDFIRQYVPNV